MAKFSEKKGFYKSSPKNSANQTELFVFSSMFHTGGYTEKKMEFNNNFLFNYGLKHHSHNFQTPSGYYTNDTLLNKEVKRATGAFITNQAEF